MKRGLGAVALVFCFAWPAHADLDINAAASTSYAENGFVGDWLRLAQSDVPVITVPQRIDTDQDTVDFTGKVQGAGEITLTADGIPIPVAADGSFRIRQQVAVGRTKLLLVAEDSAGHKFEQRVFVRRSVRVAETGDFGTYYALVIGNNRYEHLPDLNMAVKDAEAVADLLEDRYGFVVERLMDARRYDIIKAFDQLRATLTNDDNLLIYYAGHGSLDTGSDEGFWLPVDAEREVSANWVSNNDITGKLRAMRAKHVLVVADSCYSGKLTRNVTAELRTGEKHAEWLRRMAARRSRTALTSGGLEPVLDAGGGDHSVFAKAFLRALETNKEVLDGQTLFDAVKYPMSVNADQTPQYDNIRKAGHDGGDFLFVPVNVEVTVSVSVSETTAATGGALSVQQEMMLWQSIQDSTDPAMYDAYLQQFPRGTFAGVAKLKRDALIEAGPQDTQIAAIVSPPESSITVDEMDATFVALKTSNIRVEPTSESDRVGRLARDDSVAVTGKVADKNWNRIEYEGETAYIFGTLIKEVDPGELAAWEKIAEASERAGLEKFLSDYPAGHFGERAQARLTAVEEVHRTEAERIAAERKAAEEAERKRLAALVPPPRKDSFVTIGTGGITGVYYPTGGAICRLVNKGRKQHGLRCSVESTGGSAYNLNTIRAGELDMGVAQSDWHYYAYIGSGKQSFINAGPFKELRAVFSIHAEPVTIIARADAGIKTVQDLVGKRVNIGNPGSGTEATWNVIWKAMGHTNYDLKLTAQMKSAETPGALCDNKIDALFWLVGHPNGLSREATTNCDAVIVEVSGRSIDRLVAENSFYRYATIPGGMYRGNRRDVKTFGVGAPLSRRPQRTRTLSTTWSNQCLRTSSHSRSCILPSAI